MSKLEPKGVNVWYYEADRSLIEELCELTDQRKPNKLQVF
jgi:hypothetical protein